MLLRIALPATAGALAALLVNFGLIQSQTQTPNINPASQPVLVYGDQS